MQQPDHILIVDDDKDIRELLEAYLRKHGFKVTAVANGRRMNAAVESNAIDLIVLDLMLQGEDGLTLCRDLRVLGKAKAIPILMLTARNEEADRVIGLEMGADDYITKPFAARELVARIRAVLRRTRMLPPNMRLTEAAPTTMAAWPRPFSSAPLAWTTTRLAASSRSVTNCSRSSSSGAAIAAPDIEIASRAASEIVPRTDVPGH